MRWTAQEPNFRSRRTLIEPCGGSHHSWLDPASSGARGKPILIGHMHTMQEREIHEYGGEGITVTYDVKRCIHARECIKGLPAVFDPNKRPWITPTNYSISMRSPRSTAPSTIGRRTTSTPLW